MSTILSKKVILSFYDHDVTCPHDLIGQFPNDLLRRRSPEALQSVKVAALYKTSDNSMKLRKRDHKPNQETVKQFRSKVSLLGDRPPNSEVLDRYTRNLRPQQLSEVRHGELFVRELNKRVQFECTFDMITQGEGRNRIDEILQSNKYSWVCDGMENISIECSLSAVIVPLLEMCLKLATNFPQLPRQLNMMFKVICCDDSVFLKLSLALGKMDSNIPTSAMLTVSRFLYKGIEKFNSEGSSKASYKSLLDVLFRHAEKLAASGFDTNSDFVKCQNELRKCGMILSSRDEVQYANLLSENVRHASREAAIKKYFGAKTRSNLSLRHAGSYSLPGILNSEGPRHDNDFAVISLMKICPTPDELVCHVPPCLPRNHPDADHHLPSGSLEHLLDVHFRLLRHESIAPMLGISRPLVMNTSKVANIISRKGSSRFNIQQELELFDSNGNDIPQAFAFANVNYEEVQCSFTHGVVHVYTMEDINANLVLSFEERAKAWKRGDIKILTENDVGLLLRTDSLIQDVVEAAKITPVLIASIPTPCDDYENSIVSRIQISLKLIESDPIRQDFFTDPHGSYILFDIRAGFFSFQPILESLQEIDSSQASPVLKQLGLSREVLRPGLPPYLAAQDSFDISCLFKSKRPGDHRIPRDTLEVEDLLADLIEKVNTSGDCVLDKGQVAAFFSTLKRSIAITEGPPGTGKTHLGKSITDFLLANRLIGSSQSPLLCVTYTNHALDQFLEHILESNPHVKMTRIGGRSVSEKLGPYSLYSQFDALVANGDVKEFRRSSGQRHFLLKSKKDEIINNQRHLIYKMKENKPAWEDIKDIIEVEAPHLFVALDDVQYSLFDTNSLDFRTKIRHRDVIDLWLHPLKTWAKQPATKAVPQKWPQNMFSFLELDQQDYTLDTEGEELVEDSSRNDSVSESLNLTCKWLYEPSSSDIAVLPLDYSLDNIRDYDPWTLSLANRRDIMNRLIVIHRQSLKRLYMECIAEMEQVQSDLRENKEASKTNFLKTRDVIGCTVTALAKHRSTISGAKARVLLLEEAAEQLEAHTLSLISDSVEHLILIGDDRQLKAKVNCYSLQCDSGKGYDIDRSLFERLREDRNIPTSMLTIQYRMRPEISELVRRTIYHDLIDADRTKQYSSVKGMMKDLYFWDHRVLEDGCGGGDENRSASMSCDDKSKRNSHEVQCTLALVKYLLQQGYMPSQITVLTTYVGQTMLMLRALRSCNFSVSVSDRDLKDIEQEGFSTGNELDSSESMRDGQAKMVQPKQIRVATVDNFQGEENDIIIVSLVRSNDRKISGFVKVANRLNVALTRAKIGMYILGNSETLSSSDGLMRDVRDILEQRECISFQIPLYCQNHPHTKNYCNTARDFSDKAFDGGCMLPCTFRLPCGHACPKMCHSNGHEGIRCEQPCERTPPACELSHKCPKLCCQSCGKCEAAVEGVKMQSCGHLITLPCHKAVEPLQEYCTTMITVSPPHCGHELQVFCGVAGQFQNGTLSCPNICNRTLRCGHMCMGKCGKCMKLSSDLACIDLPSLTKAQLTEHDHSCDVKCDRHLICGHRCKANCHTFHKTSCGSCIERCNLFCEHSKCDKPCSSPCSLCVQKCSWHCEHQGYCELTCSTPCKRLPCNRRCEQLLPCKHRCPGVCGEKCQAFERFCVDCNVNDVTTKLMVDLIEGKVLAEVDLDLDPLVAFPCGIHVCVISSADGYMSISDVYERDLVTGDFISPKPCLITFSENMVKFCPFGCKPSGQSFSSGSLKRYGRIIKSNIGGFAQKKLMLALDPMVDKISAEIQKMITDRVVRKHSEDLEQVQAIAKEVFQLVNVLDNFRVGVDYAMGQGSFSFSNRSYREPLPHSTSKVLECGLDLFSLSPAVIDLNTLFSLAVDLPEIGTDRSTNFKVGRSLVSLSAKMVRNLFGLKAYSSLCVLVQKICPILVRLLECAEVSTKHKLKLQGGLDECLSLMVHMSSSSEYLPSIQEKFVLSSLNTATVMCSFLLKERIMVDTPDLPETKELFVTVIINLGCELFSQLVNGMVVGQEEGDSPRTELFFEISEALVSALQSVCPQDLLSWRKTHQMNLLAKLDSLLSVRILNHESKLKLEHLRQRVEKLSMNGLTDKELEDIQSAMGFRFDKRGYGGAKHWNTCPNNHPYVVGDCGGAMQEALCNECGERIGGQRHALRGDNIQGVDQFLANMRV